jgi:hypothetical protein
MSKPRIFVDTNVIIEAFRCNAWKELCCRFAVETVEKCYQESLAGNPEHPEYEPVDRDQLGKGLARIHHVTDLDRAVFLQNRPDADGLDDGEFDLLAFLDLNNLAKDSVIVLSTADRAAVVTAGGFGWCDNLDSLESLLQQAGVKGKLGGLRRHFTKRWLEEIKVRLILDQGQPKKSK